MKGYEMDAEQFIREKDKEHGTAWSEDTPLLVEFFEEYAELRVKEATQCDYTGCKGQVYSILCQEHFCETIDNS